ncbi:MAG: helicase RepA family protein [Alphaproteobacteria bacterium]|nr:helicase RepA family protein [Alphaproteobacteria bacterium]MBU2142759.1 helicase RepA family protein [Alphaproteobacteria bacterium]MBU2195181.1 helicase RepA family protein [Alphaproteobacteria bacterium]
MTSPSPIASIQSAPSNVQTLGEFTQNSPPPHYVWHRVLQSGCLYALTAPWGAGKTAIAVTIALHLAAGRALFNRGTVASRVLFLCGENPEDVKMRVQAAGIRFNIDKVTVNDRLFFTKTPFAIDEPFALQSFIVDAARYGPFDFVIVDTGPAHSSAADENDNRHMQKLALALRELMQALGNPATLVLMHPTKSATRDTLEPRGGGSFSGSVDGLLCGWKEGEHVEFFHRTKFRGPGFDPMFFELERYTFENYKDNFGEATVSVIAVPASAKPHSAKQLTGSNRIAFDALRECREDGEAPSEATRFETSPFVPEVVVSEEVWRERCYATGISDGEQDAKRKAFARTRKALLDSGKVRTFNGTYWLIDWCS